MSRDERTRREREREPSSGGPTLLAPQARRPAQAAESLAFPSSASSRSLASSSHRSKRRTCDEAPITSSAPTSRIVSSTGAGGLDGRARRTSTRTDDGAQRVSGSHRSVSTGTPLTRQGSAGVARQPAASLRPSQPDRRWEHVERARRPTSGDESASESGHSALSNFAPHLDRPTRDSGTQATLRDATGSPLRTWARWMRNSGKATFLRPAVVAIALLVKLAVGLGGYSGQSVLALPPQALDADPELPACRSSSPASPRRL